MEWTEISDELEIPTSYKLACLGYTFLIDLTVVGLQCCCFSDHWLTVEHHIESAAGSKLLRLP